MMPAPLRARLRSSWLPTAQNLGQIDGSYRQPELDQLVQMDRSPLGTRERDQPGLQGGLVS